MYTFKVSGMSCQGCVKAINKVIKAKDSQADIQIDLERAEVKVDSQLDKDQLIECIDSAGFDVEA